MANTEEKLIGRVTHYFPKVEVAIVKLEDSLKIGDKIKLKRKEEESEQEVKSMQVEHKDISEGKKGEEIGLKVDQKVKEGWEVYKII
jgi:putative protease